LPAASGDANGKGGFGAYDDEINGVFGGKCRHNVAIHNVDVCAIGDLGDARVARCHDQAVAFRVLFDRPCEAVFTPAAAQNQDVHVRPPLAFCYGRSKVAPSDLQGQGMDLFDDAPAGDDNTPEFSVSEISGAVKKAIEGGFGFVRVRGEVGRVSRPRSGHIYLDLKDDKSVLAGIIWKGRAVALPQQPEEGMEVVATGKLTTFPGQSKYQMIIEDIAPAGAGALMAMLEKRKAALAAEGLFAAERKKPLPFLPEFIGVVTSPSGAVIRDILHRLRDRFPRKHETDTTLIDFVSDVRAPTPTAAAELAVPVRMELVAWVEEQEARLSRALTGGVQTRKQRLADLARALPHKDALMQGPTQRLDFLAERLPVALRAAAAKKAVQLANVGLNAGLLRRGMTADKQRLEALGGRLKPALQRTVDQARSDLNRRTVPVPDIARSRERFAVLSQRLSDRAGRAQDARVAQLDALDRLRETLGYKETLRRGYAVVRGDGAVVSDTKAAKKVAALQIEFADGRVDVAAK